MATRYGSHNFDKILNDSATRNGSIALQPLHPSAWIPPAAKLGRLILRRG
jgi:hypothetical protein